MSSLNSCINLKGTTQCPQWSQAIQPLQVSSLLTYTPLLPATITDASSFDLTLQALPFLQTWGQRMQCPGLSTAPTDASLYPIRFAESFQCGATMSNLIKGTLGVSKECYPQSKVAAVPALCRETCQGFLEGLKAVLGDASVCGGNVTEQVKRERNTYVGIVNDVCQNLRGKDEPTPSGSSACVQMTFRDFVSCGFGNSTSGIAKARSYCSSRSDPCCSYLAADATAANNVVGNTFGSSARSSTDSSSLVIPVVVVCGLILVLGCFGGAYWFYKRRRDNDTLGIGKGKGGFGNAGTLGVDGSKGLVLGARSRLSFVRKGKADDVPDFSKLAESQPLPGQASLPTRKNTVNGESVPSLSRKLGPTAAADVSKIQPRLPPQRNGSGSLQNGSAGRPVGGPRENYFNESSSTFDRNGNNGSAGRQAPVRQDSARQYQPGQY
ncbi:hypothetical protein HDU97_003441 [Phlyctochytrium planicorne]|nr:hypothetical protein HDU97_003441 [Phlyctochytrium planicorne]